MSSVGNITHVHFAADVFSLPLKTAEHPHGLFTEHELYMVLAAFFIAIFFDLDITKSFALQQAAHAAANKLGAIVEANVKFANKTGFISGLTDKMSERSGPLKDYGIHMIRQLLAAGLTPYEVTWSQMLPTAGAMVANQAQVVSLCALSGSPVADTKHSSLKHLTTTSEKAKSTFPKSTVSRNSTHPKQTTFYCTIQWRVSVSQEHLACTVKPQIRTSSTTARTEP
jgi:hypothetical protein